MYYDYMPALEDSAMNGYGDENNRDLDSLLDFSGGEGTAAVEHIPTATNSMFDFGGRLTPNGMNINGGMMIGTFAENMFPFSPNHGLPHCNAISGFPFPQQVNPAAIMGPTQNGFQPSEDLQNFSNNQEQVSGMSYSHSSEVAVKQSEEPEEVVVPKPKRTRRSKKKKLTPEQEDKKRREFLERNRQAASKCRARKQEQNSTLQARAQEASFLSSQMKEEVAFLKTQIADLSNTLFSHSNCNDPDIKAAIEHYASIYPASASTLGDNGSSTRPVSSHSFAANSNPFTPSWEMQRSGSAMSNSSQLYKPDGSPSSVSGDTAVQMLKKAGKKQLKMGHDYMAGYKEYKQAMEEQEIAMSRQNSNGSSSSSSASGSTHEGSGHTSAITTPENSAKEMIYSMATRATRRGVPHKSLENPRNKSLVDPSRSLPGISPSKFLTQQQS
jgi:hypothetical protein